MVRIPSIPSGLELEQPYPESLSTYPFLERALEASPKHTDLSDEILSLVDRAKQAYQLLADVNCDITSLAQELPKLVK